MVYLLGGSGYVGKAYQAFLERRGIGFRNLKRAEVDYLNTTDLTAALLADKVCFLINAAGYTGKPNVDACELDKTECLVGNAILPGRIADACATAGVPWGHVSSGCIYTGTRPDGSGFTETDEPNFTFRQNNSSFYSGTKALGEEVLASASDVYIWRLRIPFDHRESPRNYLTKVMSYNKLLDATNSVSQLQEFVEATFKCWETRVPFGIYNVTNPGQITTRQVVDHILASRVLIKDFSFFRDESEFMQIAAKTPRSNCVLSSAKLASVGITMTEVNEAIVRDLRCWERV
jgi:dTDP-4-dehydrorhamnose reductase